MTKPRINSKAREDRAFEISLEQRAGEEKPLRIIGHPVVYERWSEDLGGFRERILPGAYTKSLLESDIRALFNHDSNYVLGRNRAGTLSLVDQAGSLRMELFPPETPTVRDLILTPMERGDLTQMSHSFRAVRDEWREPKKEGDLWERDLLEARMFDVSIVTFPAYTQTDAAVRSVLTGAGIAYDALAAALVRVDRGIPLTQSDCDLFEGAVTVLRSYLPAAPEPEGDHADQPQAGRSVAHLRRLLELAEAV